MNEQLPAIEVSIKTPGLRSGEPYDIHITTRDVVSRMTTNDVDAEVAAAVVAWAKAKELMDKGTGGK